MLPGAAAGVSRHAKRRLSRSLASKIKVDAQRAEGKQQRNFKRAHCLRSTHTVRMFLGHKLKAPSARTHSVLSGTCGLLGHGACLARPPPLPLSRVARSAHPKNTWTEKTFLTWAPAAARQSAMTTTKGENQRFRVLKMPDSAMIFMQRHAHGSSPPRRPQAWEDFKRHGHERRFFFGAFFFY